MSNKKEKVQVKFEVPVRIKDKLDEMYEQTGFSRTTIFCMLVDFYLTSPLDVEHDVRRALDKLVKQNTNELKLTPRQKRVIQNATDFLDEYE